MMNTTQEDTPVSFGCFSQVFIRQGIAVKKFLYTNGHLLRPEIQNKGYDDVISISSAEDVIQNEHLIHSQVSMVAKSLGLDLFPEYIDIPEEQKCNFLLSRAATCDISQQQFTLPLMHTLIEHLALAMGVLHCAKVFHGDIKEQNILWVNKSQCFQVTDFGCSSLSLTMEQAQRDLMQCAQMLVRICTKLCVHPNPFVQQFLTLYTNYKSVYSRYI